MRRERPAGGCCPCGPLCVPGPDRVGALRLRGAKRRASPKGLRRIVWEAVEGPLRSWARSTADDRVSCPCRPATGVLSRGPFQRFGEVALSRAALRPPAAPLRAAGPCLAGLLTACAAVLCGAPLRAFLPQRGVSNLTVVARPALSRRSAVSKRFCTGRPPLWCWRYVPRVSEVRGVYAPSILLCLCCYWLVWSVLRLSLSVLHFLVNVFDS